MTHTVDDWNKLIQENRRLQALVDASTGNSFLEELQCLINRYSEENVSNTPDYILASYLVGCLEVWNSAANARQTWYSNSMVQDMVEEPIEVKIIGKNERPHSRACGIVVHAHGIACHRNCPSCGGR